MLYTVVPQEEIFGEEPSPVLIDVARGQAVLRVSISGAGQAQVRQLISTNPNDYLQPQYMPGSAVALTAADLAAWQATMHHESGLGGPADSVWGDHE